MQRVVAAVDGPLTEARLDPIPGALLFADVSGFTALTERLSAVGPAGVETLSRVLNEFFGALISVVADHGGDVLKFAGDALVISFSERGLGAEARRESVQRAAACGLAVQAAVRGFESEDGIPLSLKVAVSAGHLDCAYVGGVWGRWEMVLFGRPLSDAGRAADVCPPGAVALSAQAWADIGGEADAEVLPSGVALLSQLTVAPEPTVHEPPTLTEAAAAAAWTFLPGAIRSRLQHGQGHFLAELRKLTVLFVTLPGSDLSLAQSQELLVRLQQLVYSVEGSVNKISVDDKGLSLIPVLGMPPLAHEDDPRRGLTLALHIRDLMRELGLPCAVGVATGRLFCGVIGSDARCEYTMIGDTANLAARLMVASDGDVLCDQTTRDAATAHFEFDALTPLKLKGKAAPVSVFRPRRRFGPARDAARGADEVIIGRVAQLRDFERALDDVAAGTSTTVVVEADAGVGKSHLLRAFVHAARRREGFRVFKGAADAIERSTSYVAFRHLVLGLFGVDHNAGLERRAAAVRAMFAGQPDLLHVAPVLSSVAPFGLPDTAHTRGLEADGRAVALRNVVLAALRHHTSGAAVVLVIEDSHWMDSASWALLQEILRSVSPLLVVVATRPVEPSKQAPEQRAMLALQRCEHVLLDSLSPELSRELICRRLGVDEVSEDVAAFVSERTRGNAFFTEQLTLAMRDADLLELSQGSARVRSGVDLAANVGIPDTVDGVVTQRIDRLSPTDQLALKVGSVVGRVFGAQVVNDVFPVVDLRGDLGPHLHELVQTGLTLSERDAAEPAYLFRHIITQEVTYNLMLYAQRQALHSAVADWYEAHHDDLSPHYSLLAHHRVQAGQSPPAIRYLMLAGDQALQRSASSEALSLYAQAAQLDAERADGPDRELQARCALKCGQAHYALARLSESTSSLKTFLRLAGHPLPDARWRLALMAASEVLLEALQRRVPSLRPRVAAESARAQMRAVADACNQLTITYYTTQEALPLLVCVLRGFRFAQRAGPGAALGRALGNMATLASILRRADTAEAYQDRALAQLPHIDDPLRRAGTWMAVSISRGGNCDWARAIAGFRESLRLAEEGASPRSTQLALQGVARCSLRAGHFDDAANAYLRMNALGRATDNGQAIAWSLGGLLQVQHAPFREQYGDRVAELAAHLAAEEERDHLTVMDKALSRARMAMALWRLGSHDEARDLAADTADQLLGIDIVVTYAADAYVFAAEVLLGSVRESARHEADDRGRLARLGEALGRYAKKAVFCGPIAARIQADIVAISGEPTKAIADLRRALALAERRNMPYEATLCRRSLLRTLPADSGERAPLMREARAALVRMGCDYDVAALDALDVPAG